MGSTRRQQ